MSKKRRRLKNKREVVNVFSKTGSDSSNDTKGQLHLLPGTPGYEEYQQRRKEALEKKTQEEPFHAQLETENRSLRIVQVKKDEIQAAYNNTGQKKYRRFMSKDVQVRKMTDVIEDGLGRNIPRRDFEDELFDDGISGDDFPKEAARDYKKEFESVREIPTVDTNGDGVVDGEDDSVMTPGMRRLGRYM